MFKSNSLGLVAVLGVALLAVACGDEEVTPTAPTPAPQVTLTGTWTGAFTGTFVSGDGQAMLMQEGTTVTGEWSAPMPAALVAVGAPAEVDLEGPVTGSVSGTTATLEFAFLEIFAPYFGSPDCGLDVSVSSFDQTSLEATWNTNDSCTPPIVDMGTISFMRQ